MKAEAAGAYKYSSTGLVLDSEYQTVKLSSTLCGTAKGIHLRKANSEASMKWKMSSPLPFLSRKLESLRKWGVRAWKRRRRRRRRTHTIGRSNQREGTPITSCVCAYACIVRDYQVGNGHHWYHCLTAACTYFEIFYVHTLFCGHTWRHLQSKRAF